ncbi:hypothetical protein ACFWGP_12030 [Agromyces sp. NPDC127015]|uniref:hypothetical protein n=1 Tax=Agromyces sp. NPDC127015 TaxID=3347108 RepID=UPI0036654179
MNVVENGPTRASPVSVSVVSVTFGSLSLVVLFLAALIASLYLDVHTDVDMTWIWMMIVVVALLVYVVALLLAITGVVFGIIAAVRDSRYPLVWVGLGLALGGVAACVASLSLITP